MACSPVDAQLREDGNGDSPRNIFRVVLAEKVLELVQQSLLAMPLARCEPASSHARRHLGAPRGRGVAAVGTLVWGWGLESEAQAEPARARRLVDAALSDRSR